MTAPRTAVGLTTAALATVTLFSETAGAAPASPAPQPSIAEVKAKVDALMHQAEVATETYNGAKEKTTAQNATVNKLLAQAAQKTQALNDSRRVLGQYAAAQYRTGGDDTTAVPDVVDPQDLRLDAPMKRMSGNGRSQPSTPSAPSRRRRHSSAPRRQGARRAERPRRSWGRQADVRQAGRGPVAAQQPHRAGEGPAGGAPAKKEEEAGRGRGDRGQGEGRRDAAAAAAAKRHGTDRPDGPAAPVAQHLDHREGHRLRPRASSASRMCGARRVRPPGTARADPGGVEGGRRALPRTTGDQVMSAPGSRVRHAAGDLSSSSRHSHVGLYIGGGEMIHAPHTGTVVKVAPITEMPIYGVVRPTPTHSQP